MDATEHAPAPTPGEADDTADGLSAKHIRFCQLYFETDNATQSYIDAGLPHPNYDAARVYACRLVTNRNVAAYLTRLRKVAADAARITVEELAALVRSFATADFKRIMTPTGEFLPLDQWPDDVSVAVESLETEEILEPDPDTPRKKRLKGHTRKVKFVSKMAAAARLMEWKRMTGQDKAGDTKAASDSLVLKGVEPSKL